MKKIAFLAKSILLCSAITIVSCSGNESNSPIVTNDSTAVVSGASLNIRYIDGDSVTAHYNLALDFKEASIRTMSKLENAQRAKAAEIQKFGSQIEQKMKSNGYLSEASYNADIQKFNKMQSDAQGYLATLERNAQQELLQQQMQLNDSIDSFIKDYNAKHGYDAILFKNAGVYFNPALDITNEVIEGLNARYNKIEK